MQSYLKKRGGNGRHISVTGETQAKHSLREESLYLTYTCNQSISGRKSGHGLKARLLLPVLLPDFKIGLAIPGVGKRCPSVFNLTIIS